MEKLVVVLGAENTTVRGSPTSLGTGAGEPAPASAGGANHDRHDRGRDHPARTHFDQESGEAARSSIGMPQMM